MESRLSSRQAWMYPCALICKICSFEKLTRNCGSESKLQNPARLSARVATRRLTNSRFNRLVPPVASHRTYAFVLRSNRVVQRPFQTKKRKKKQTTLSCRLCKDRRSRVGICHFVELETIPHFECHACSWMRVCPALHASAPDRNTEKAVN